MEWVNGGAAWEAKSIAVEVAHQWVETGRICSEVRCTARSEMAFPVARMGVRWEAGFCLAHGVVFSSMGPAGYTIGEPRRLEEGEPLAGPLAQEDEPTD